MPDMDGLQLQEVLAQTSTRLAVVFVTGNAGIADSVRAMKAGAVDFLTKPFEDTQLLGAVEVAFQKSRKMHEEAEEIERCWRLYDSLTPRERQVCVLVSRGLLNKQVGGELGIQEKTIKLHRSNVMRKLGVTSLADLVRLVEILRQADRLDSGTEPVGPSAQVGRALIGRLTQQRQPAHCAMIALHPQSEFLACAGQARLDCRVGQPKLNAALAR